MDKEAVKTRATRSLKRLVAPARTRTLAHLRFRSPDDDEFFETQASSASQPPRASRTAPGSASIEPPARRKRNGRSSERVASGDRRTDDESQPRPARAKTIKRAGAAGAVVAVAGLGVLLLTGAFTSSPDRSTRKVLRSPRGSPAPNRSLTSSHQRPPRAYEPAAATWPRTPCTRTSLAHATAPPETSSITVRLGRIRPSRWPSQRRRRPGPPMRAT